MIKAVFFDIDGTLVSFKTHDVHHSTIKAIDELKRNGIKVFIATGRHELLIDNVDKSLFDGIISLNGQCVRAGEEIIYYNAMTAEDAERASEYAVEHGIATIFEGVDFIKINTVTDMARQGAALLNLKLPVPCDITGVHKDDILQLIFFADDCHEEKLLEVMPSCESTRWTHLLCDVMPLGGGKHVGIEKMIEHFGLLPEECMAFGDAENDITMIQYVGTGIAMGNAAREVKAAADYVTTGTDSGGIAKALRHFGML